MLLREKKNAPGYLHGEILSIHSDFIISITLFNEAIKSRGDDNNKSRTALYKFPCALGVARWAPLVLHISNS